MNYNTIAARFPETLSPSLDFPTPLAAERIFSPATQRDRSRDPRSVPVSSGRLDPQRMSNTLPVQSPLRPCIRQKSLARYGRLELCFPEASSFVLKQAIFPSVRLKEAEKSRLGRVGMGGARASPRAP